MATPATFAGPAPAGAGVGASAGAVPVATGSATANTAPVVVGGGVATPAVPPLRLRWVAPASVRVGDTFSVQLVAGSDEPVTALGLQLAFDAQALQTVSVLEGSFLRQGGVASTFGSRVEPGRITVNTSRAGTTGASIEAPLLTLNLRASVRPAEGQITLQLASVSPLGVQGRALGTQALPALIVAVQP